MRSPIKLRPVTPPTEVETELADLCKNGASQGSIADACGLACHQTIGDRIGKALTKRRGFLAEFTGEQVVRLAASFGPLGNAVRAFIDQEMASQGEQPSNLTDEVRHEISAGAALISKVNESTADNKLTRSEKADLVIELQKSVDRQLRLIAHIRVSMQEVARG